jgi:hypothetical protein
VTSLTQEFVLSADELFVTNSVIGIWPIKSVAGTVYSLGPWTKKISHYLTESSCLQSLAHLNSASSLLEIHPAIRHEQALALNDYYQKKLFCWMKSIKLVIQLIMVSLN